MWPKAKQGRKVHPGTAGDWWRGRYSILISLMCPAIHRRSSRRLAYVPQDVGPCIVGCVDSVDRDMPVRVLNVNLQVALYSLYFAQRG
eukprot:jgi/Botrbrau1/16610/Bobra.0068s0037.1